MRMSQRNIVQMLQSIRNETKSRKFGKFPDLAGGATIWLG
jgi:hypothetical protein